MRRLSPLIILIGVSILSIALAGYFYYQNIQVKKQLNNPNPSSKINLEDPKELIAQVNKLIDLPLGEDPTVATVTDISKLNDQIFFQKAKNGDKVIIYSNAKKAILYDPVANKIVDVAPLDLSTSSATPQKIQTSVVIRNGTKIVGLASKVEDKLKKSNPDINIISKENSKNDYPKSIVVVLNDEGKDQASTIAKTLNSQLGELPSNEPKPSNAEILILLGPDAQ